MLNEEIAEWLVQQHASVRCNVSRILTKLHLHDRFQIVVAWYKSGDCGTKHNLRLHRLLRQDPIPGRGVINAVWERSAVSLCACWVRRDSGDVGSVKSLNKNICRSRG